MIRPLRTFVPLVAAWLTLAGVTVSAASKNSSQFPYKYEGNVLPIPKYDQVGTFSPTGPFTSGPSTDGNILTYNSTIATGQAFWQSKDTVGDTQEWRDLISDSVGWTFEIRVKVRTTGVAGEEGAFRFAMSDGVDYGPPDQMDPDARGSYTIVAIRTDGIWTSDGNGVLWTPLVGGTNPNLIDNQFHTLRFAQLPSSSDFNLWVDNQLFLSSHGFDYVGPASQVSQNWFGDGGGLAGGKFVEIDYVRWDHTGVYEPAVGLTGDYNGNGAVDAADYVLWRDTLGQSGAGLAADGSGNGTVDLVDYDVWRSAFGSSSGLGTVVTAVPEPTATALAAAILSTVSLVRSRRRSI